LEHWPFFQSNFGHTEQGLLVNKVILCKFDPILGCFGKFWPFFPLAFLVTLNVACFSVLAEDAIKAALKDYKRKKAEKVSSAPSQ
jgi:hypothetical protein